MRYFFQKQLKRITFRAASGICPYMSDHMQKPSREDHIPTAFTSSFSYRTSSPSLYNCKGWFTFSISQVTSEVTEGRLLG